MLWHGSRHHSPLQNPSTSVLRGRLVSSCNSIPLNPFLHVLSWKLFFRETNTGWLDKARVTLTNKTAEHEVQQHEENPGGVGQQ